MTLTVYVDVMSQPCRALLMLLKECNIQHDVKITQIFKQQTKSEAYTKINPHQKVPAIVDNDFTLTESCTILRYLCTTRNVASNWYGGNDIKLRSRIDEFLDWYHTGLRYGSTRLMRGIFFPTLLKQDLNDPQYKSLADIGKQSYYDSLDTMQKVWLSKNKFLCGDHVSIADLIAVPEILQIAVTGLSIDKYPVIKEYLERVRQSVKSFDEVHKPLYMSIQRLKKQSYVAIPSGKL